MVERVERVEEGSVQSIRTTAIPEIVDIMVLSDQILRPHPRVNGLNEGIPEVGKELPPGWRGEQVLP